MYSNLPQLSRGSESLSALVKRSAEPVIIVLTLIGTAFYYDEPLDQHYAVLSLLILLITFPGEWPSEGMGKFARQTLSSWFALCLLLVALGYATGTVDLFPQEVLLTWLMIIPFAVFSSCLLLKLLSGRVKTLRAKKKKAVVLGATNLAMRLVESIESDEMSPVEIVGFFEDRSPNRLEITEKVPMLGKASDVADYARHNQVDIIYVTLPMAAQPRIIRLVEALRDTTASVYFLPDIFIHDLIQARLDSINGIPMLVVCETPFLGVNGLMKHLFDYIVASIILVLISPIMLLIALGVKLTSKGPVIFRQHRYGLDGREILVYKFRSMTVTENGAKVVQATKNDSRVTPLGAFLRKTSLDELPQFINVLEGKMSIVGPRPHAVAHNETYRKLIKGYMVRHKVKPGITGWAQVNGYRGETETLEKMEKRIQFDLDYLRRWSIYLDIWIIFRTLTLVLKDHKAY